MEKIYAKAARYFLLGIVLTKLLSLFSDILLARRYGAGVVSDAFIVAQAVPTFLFAALAMAVTINLPRLFYREGNFTVEEQNRFTSTLLGAVLALALIVGTAVFIFPQYVVKAFAFGFDENTAALAVRFTKILIFAVFPVALASVLKGFSHAKNKLPAFSVEPVLFYACLTAGIAISTAEKVYLIAYAALAGYVLAMIPGLIRAVKNKFRYIPSFSFQNKKTKGFVTMLAPALLFYTGYEIIHLIDRTLASTVGPGVVSSLRYAQKLQNIIVILVFFFIYSVLFPLLGRSFEEGKIESFRQSVRSTLIIALLWTFPFIIFLTALSSPVVRLIYQHGAFDGVSLIRTSHLFAGYALIILPLSLRLLLDNAFFVMREIKIPVITALITLALNVGLDFLLVPRMGEVGIVLAALGANIIHVVILFSALKERIGAFGLWGIVKNFLKLLLAAGPIGLALVTAFTLTFYSMRPTLAHLLIILTILFFVNFIAFRILMRLLRVEGFHYLYLYRDRLKAVFRPTQVHTQHSFTPSLQPVSTFVAGYENYFDMAYDYESMLRGNERTAELFDDESAYNFLQQKIDLKADEEALNSELASIKEHLIPSKIRKRAKRQYLLSKRHLTKAVAKHKHEKNEKTAASTQSTSPADQVMSAAPHETNGDFLKEKLAADNHVTNKAKYAADKEGSALQHLDDMDLVFTNPEIETIAAGYDAKEKETKPTGKEKFLAALDKFLGMPKDEDFDDEK